LPERRGGPVLIALTDRMEEVGLRPVLGFGRWSFPSARSVTGGDGGTRRATPGVAACVEEGALIRADLLGYVTRFAPHAQRDMLKIPRPDTLRILYRLIELQKAMDAGDAMSFDIKALQGHSARWRLRVGDYRVVYTVEDGQFRRESRGRAPACLSRCPACRL